jgi:ubiquinone/menaquinone biosynthesis C-methylase UbiE
VGRVRLAARALRLALTGAHANPTADYDAASTDYDDFFGKVMGEHAAGALAEVPLRPGDAVVELACGTGQLTVEIARRLAGSGSIRAVDASAGMLTVAQEKLTGCADLELTFEHGDMFDFLAAQPSASADAIVCGWAICYGRPVRLLEEAARVLRPGGRIVVIETRADALVEMKRVLEHIFAADPALLTGLIRVSLPKNAGTLGRWFGKAGLIPTVLRDGEQVLPCATADEAVEYVERSGAAAGFRDAVEQSRADEVRQRLRAGLNRHAVEHGGLRLRHTFVVGVGHRPAGSGPLVAAGDRRT